MEPLLGSCHLTHVPAFFLPYWPLCNLWFIEDPSAWLWGFIFPSEHFLTPWSFTHSNVYTLWGSTLWCSPSFQEALPSLGSLWFAAPIFLRVFHLFVCHVPSDLQPIFIFFFFFWFTIFPQCPLQFLAHWMGSKTTDWIDVLFLFWSTRLIIYSSFNPNWKERSSWVQETNVILIFNDK